MKFAYNLGDRVKRAVSRKEKKIPEVKERKCTDNELKQFAIVPADDKNDLFQFLINLCDSVSSFSRRH